MLGLGNSDFNEGFDKYRDEVQNLGDKEEKAILEAIDKYSPSGFLDKLRGGSYVAEVMVLVVSEPEALCGNF